MGSASYPLNFPVNAGSPSPLRDIASAAAEIAKQTKTSTGELNIFNAVIANSSKQGISLKQTLLDLSKANDTVTPGINRLAKELLGADAGFTAASAGAQRFGNSIRSNVVAPVTAASGAIRVLGGQSVHPRCRESVSKDSRPRARFPSRLPHLRRDRHDRDDRPDGGESRQAL